MAFKQLKEENLEKIRRFEQSSVQDSMWDGSVSFYPQYIQIEHTTRCNGRCIMCNHLYTANRGARDLETNVLYAIEDILQYVQTVMLNGDGEPFLCADIKNSLALFRKYEVSVGANTNLTVVSDEIWDYIASDFSFLNISCDGSTGELFETIRRGLSFEVFVRNLKKLNTMAPNLRKNLDCVLMRQNIGDMENLVRFAADYGFASIRFHALGVNPVIGNGADAPMLYPHYLAAHAIKAREAAEQADIAIQLPAIPLPDERLAKSERERADEAGPGSRKAIGQALSLREQLSRQYLAIPVTREDLSPAAYDCGQMCRWALERCYLDLDGNMTTCCYDNVHRYGSLREQTFDQIWNGTLYKQFRTEMMQGRLPAWCGSCQWLKNPQF
jgi:MoaA/NifB/PqqE/SkfB family radical SAM enzyme